MLTDQELLDAIAAAPSGWTSQATLLAIGRAVERAVMEKLVQRQPLTPEQIITATDDIGMEDGVFIRVARTIESAHGITPDPVLSDDLCDAYGVPRGSRRSEVNG